MKVINRIDGLMYSHHFIQEKEIGLEQKQTQHCRKIKFVYSSIKSLSFRYFYPG